MGEATIIFFLEKTPSSLSRLAGFWNLGYASLWGAKVSVSEIWGKCLFRKQNRLAAEGGLALSAANVIKAGFSRLM